MYSHPYRRTGVRSDRLNKIDSIFQGCGQTSVLLNFFSEHVEILYTARYIKGMSSRETILKQGLSLFAQKGYNAVGVQEICDACGVTKPTLYHFFGSKRGLLEAIFASHYPALLECVKKSCEYHRDLQMNLERLAACFFSFALEQRTFNRLLLSVIYAPPENEVSEIIKGYTGKIFGCIKTLFVTSIPEYGNLRGKELLLTSSFLGLMRSYVGLFLSGEVKLDDSLSRSIVKQFMYGIFS